MRRKQIIDPKTLRKHSKIVEQRAEPLLVVGERVQADYGFYINNHKGKTFETKFMLIMPSCMTPTWFHPKKTRLFRVVGGIGQFQVFADDGTVTTKPISVGDEVVAEAGFSYRITSSPSKLELYVTQDAKYEASLQEVAPAEVVAELTSAELHSISGADKINQISMGSNRELRRNRAREQLAAQRGEAPIRERKKGQSEDSFFSTTASAGINAMPVLDFDPDSAG